MKKLSETFTENTHKTPRTGRKHAMEIATMKRANMDTHNLITKKTTPTQTMNDHRISSYLTAMTKPFETLFNRTPENWPKLEHHLLTEAKNPTIRWNHKTTNFQPIGGISNTFNFLEGYLDLPENMTFTLLDDLKDAQQLDPVTPASQLYKLH
jgi:hypothetical protein